MSPATVAPATVVTASATTPLRCGTVTWAYEWLRESRKDSLLFLAYLPLGYLDTLAWLPRASPEVPHVQAELTRGRLEAAC